MSGRARVNRAYHLERMAVGTYNVVEDASGYILGWVLRNGTGWIACTTGIGRINGDTYRTRVHAADAVWLRTRQ